MRLFSRCSRSPLTAIVLIVSNHILPSIAVSSGATLFNIPTGSDSGSCDGQDIDGIISEAAKMADAAITAITNYQAASLLSTPSQAVLNTYEAAFAMFGAEGTKLPIVNRVSISSSGNAILENVKSEYRQMIVEAVIQLIFLNRELPESISSLKQCQQRWGIKTSSLSLRRNLPNLGRNIGGSEREVAGNPPGTNHHSIRNEQTESTCVR